MGAKDAVCYVVLGNGTKQLSGSLLSLVKSYLSDVTLDVYVFNEQVAAEDLLVLEKLPAMVGKPQIHVKSHSLVELPAELIGKVKEHVNPLYLQRLFLPGVLRDYDRVLYLDNDTLLYESVDQLFQQLPVTSEQLIAAVRDFYMYVFGSMNTAMPIYGVADVRNYVNAGVVLYNVARYNATYSRSQLEQLIAANLEMPWLDQSLLNKLTVDRVHYLDLAYNFQKTDAWLQDWALPTETAAAKEIAQARRMVKIRHLVDDTSWDHMVAYNQFEVDTFQLLAEVKQLSHVIYQQANLEAHH